MDRLNDDGGIPGRPSIARDVAWIALVAAVYFATARLSLAVIFEPEGIAAVWPPAGIFLSAVLLTRRSLRPHLAATLFVTDLIAEVLAGTALPVSGVYALSLTGDALLSAWLLRRFLGGTTSFGRVRDVFGFLGLVVVLSNSLWSLVAAAAAAHLQSGVSFWSAWKWWAASDGIGNVLVTPLVMSWASFLRKRGGSWKPTRVVEAAILFASFALSNVVAFGHASEHGEFSLLLNYLTLPFLLWAALRFGVRGVSLSVAILAAIAVRSVVTGSVAVGAFHHAELGVLIVVQLYLALVAVPALVLAAVVTEREHAHGALRESESSLATAQRMAHLGNWTVEIQDPGDFTRNPLQWSDEVFRIFGYLPGSVPVSHELFAQAIHADDRSRVMGEIRRTLQEGNACDVQHRIVRPDGSARIVREHAETIVDAGTGRWPRLVGTMQDVTDQNRLEDQLRQSQKMEAIGQLAGGVAHDFNNLLTVIESYASLLRDGGSLSEADARSAGYILDASERAATLTRRLLLFSRKQVMQPVSLDLNDVVGQMAKLLRRILGEDVALRTECGSDLPPIRGDAGMVEQVLLNLAVNARDAMPSGGDLTIATSMETVSPPLAREQADVRSGPCVCLSVADTGCGIPPENLSRIFEPFFTTKDLSKGTGLGLATVYGIVKQHQGWIDVTSDVNNGTTFRIYFPAAERRQPEPAAASAGYALPRGDETVLVVEDEPSVRSLVRTLLEGCGYTVLLASSGVAALEVWREHAEKIALLLTDMVMPDGLSGRELADRLTAEKPGLKVIYTSGYSVELLGGGAPLVDSVNFLQKPYHPARLAQTLRSRLDHD